jgi:hypothetical protein
MDFQQLQSALLETGSLAEAAERLGVPLSALLREMDSPETRKRLDAEARAIYAESMRRLQRGISSAIDMLRSACDPATPAEKMPNKERIQAATSLLAQGNKAGQKYAAECRMQELEDAISRI